MISRQLVCFQWVIFKYREKRSSLVGPRVIEPGTQLANMGVSDQGPGKSQPFVRYSDLEKLFVELFEALEQLSTDLGTSKTAGFNIPDPGSIAASITLAAKLGAIKAASANFTALASTRIFGE